jgi:hypothetical protein
MIMGMGVVDGRVPVCKRGARGLHPGCADSVVQTVSLWHVDVAILTCWNPFGESKMMKSNIQLFHACLAFVIVCSLVCLTSSDQLFASFYHLAK